MAQATLNLTNAEWLQERIKKAVQQEVDAWVANEVGLAVERIKKEIPAIAARVGIEMQGMVHYDRIGADLRITITERKD